MKLLTKSGLNFISASIFFFLFGSLGGYYFIRYAVNKLLNSELLGAKNMIEQREDNFLTFTYADVSVDTIHTFSPLIEPVFSDTVIKNKKSNSYDFYRKLTFDRQYEDVIVRYHIVRPSAPSDLLIMKFTLMLTVFPVLFFLILYFVNRGSTKYSLSVFYDTIEKLKSFDVSKDNSLELMASDVDEFEQLNEVFNAMGEKIREDYERLKEYTENTSHELQTPLAIITSKLDELIQSDNLTEPQVKSIAGMIETANRLSKINQSLIFLAKLDNRIFSNEEQIIMSNLVNEQAELLGPMIEDRNLTFTIDQQQPLEVRMNHSLAHTLIQNLLKNAIRHNVPDGYIKVKTFSDVLVVSNSGLPLSFNPEELFDRFHSNSSHPQSLGIGLSIVKRICEISNIDISYQVKDSDHHFRLKFG